MEKIKKWLIGSGYGFGFGSGSGSGDDSGYGYGSGSGYGNGYGDGYGFGCGDGDGSGSDYSSGSGYGSGYGNGYGDGDGSGSGSGDDSGYGFGSGSGYGNKIAKVQNDLVYKIDNIDTIITLSFKNYAKGFIVGSDFSLTPCYVAKNDFGVFAHGKTLKEAYVDLREKEMQKMSTEQRINCFLKKFDLTKKYSGKEFFEWHHVLTGSCLMGREEFVKGHGLSLTKKYSVNEFINLCENDFGGQVIKELKNATKRM